MYIYMYIYIYICMYVFTTEGFFEVAIESWPEWDLNPRPLNSFVQLLQFNRLFSVTFHFGYRLCQSPRLFELKASRINHECSYL